MNEQTRKFEAITPAANMQMPLLIGLCGPPGGGKTVSAIRLAVGMQRVYKGPIVLLDTECGRSVAYHKSRNPQGYDFQYVEFKPPFASTDFLDAIRQQLPLNPAAIIVDTMSDEHDGEGGYIEYHDEMVPKMGGNEWAAWSKPQARRKRLFTGLLQMKTPLLLTFRATEKSEQVQEGGKKKIKNMGWMPTAPLKLVHALNLTCILPPRSNGVPVWTSEKLGEDFIIKLPNYLAPYIEDGKQLDENMGEAFARWAKGDSAKGPLTIPAGVKPVDLICGESSGLIVNLAHDKKDEKILWIALDKTDKRFFTDDPTHAGILNNRCADQEPVTLTFKQVGKFFEILSVN